MNPARQLGVSALAIALMLASSARCDQPFINEVLGGCGDVPAGQFVEIGFSAARNDWAGCVQLEFRDEAGGLLGTFEFTTNPAAASSANTALVATEAFAALPGAPRPDFIMPPLVATPAGEICLRDTGRPACEALDHCLAYGGPTPRRPDRQAPLPLGGELSLRHPLEYFLDFGLPYELVPPTPKNAAGIASGLRCLDRALVAQGERLFFEETFDGNGRTCGTCHPAGEAFAIGPTAVAALPPTDPLFVAEAVPGLADLERPPLLRGPRALILENVDGFGLPHVFRGTPHLLNVGGTAPYGFSGDVPDLRTFAANAVRQHFPRSLARIPGADFREPTEDELAAMEAFMQSLVAGNPGGAFVYELALDPSASRGRDLFFGKGQCGFCHNGPFFSASFFGEPFALRFDTGVTRRPNNVIPPPECPDCPPIGPLEHDRSFDTPTLLGIRDTAPFFHDNSAATLRDAVAHYASPSFNQSPAASFVGRIELTAADIDDVTAFLESLTACGNGALDAGEACDDGNVLDGDCCSAACDVAAAEGLSCDDGNTCTTATECRSGRCVRVDAEVCGGRSCTASDVLTPAVATCALASLGAPPRECPVRAARVQRSLDRAVRLVEGAMGADSAARTRKMLKRAAGTFGHAGRLAFGSPIPGCLDDAGVAAFDAQTRTLCLRECAAGRGR